MAQQYDVQDLAELMRRANAEHKPFVFFAGAGCSVSAGIPLAHQLLEQLQQDFSVELKLLSEAERKDYGKCMAQIGRDARRQFLKRYTDQAKINWAHIALACLLQAGYIGRVLTFNFDHLLARSCGLLGLYPATYDFTAANLNLYHLIDNPAIVHLHGQSHGFAQLNSDKETSAHAKQLSQFVQATLNESPALVIGYSGQADAFFPQIKAHFNGQHRLFWVDMTEQAPAHIEAILHSPLAHYLRCADGADVFLIQLAQALDCFPPSIFTDPYAHLLEEIDEVTDYPPHQSHAVHNQDPSDTMRSTPGMAEDILQGLKQRLQQAQADEQAQDAPNYLDWYLQGHYQRIITHAEETDSLDSAEQIWVARAYFRRALQHTDLEQALSVYDQLIQRFGSSQTPELQEQVAKALFNKGIALKQLEGPEQALKVYDQLIQHFENNSTPAIQAQVAKALLNKGVTLGRLEDPEQELKIYDQLIQRFASSEAPELQEPVANALFNKGNTLRQLEGPEQALKVYEQLIQRFASSEASEVQEQVAKALINKGVTLGQLEGPEQALSVYDQLIQRFGNSQTPELQEPVARALLYKGVALGQLERPEPALKVYDQLIQRFGSSEAPKLQALVAEAKEAQQELTESAAD